MKSNEKIKVLMLSPFFYPHKGGVEKHVYDVSSELIKRNYEVAVLTCKHDNNLPTSSRVDGIDIYRFTPNTLPIIGMIITMFKLLKYIRLVFQSKVVHCHDYQMFIWFIFLRILFPSKKMFITFHGWEGDFPPNKLIVILRKISEKLTRGNICIGSFIEKWYNTKASIISYGGVSFNQNKTSPQYKSDILVLSRMSHDIPIQKYLDTFKIIKDVYSNNIEITFLGKGELEETVRLFSEENDLNISLKGFVDNPLDYINSTSIVIANGYLAILESASKRKPVFAIYQNELEQDRLSTFPFAKDFILLSNDPKDFAEQINTYLLDQDKSDFKFTELYNWTLKQTWINLTKKYITLWNQ